MKKSLLTIVLIISLGVTGAMAHGRHQGKRMENERPTAEQRAEKLAQELDLTEQQKNEVTALYKRQDEERQKDREARKIQREKKTEENRLELKEIIGEEKLAQYNKVKLNKVDKNVKAQRIDGVHKTYARPQKYNEVRAMERTEK